MANTQTNGIINFSFRHQAISRSDAVSLPSWLPATNTPINFCGPFGSEHTVCPVFWVCVPVCGTNWRPRPIKTPYQLLIGSILAHVCMHSDKSKYISITGHLGRYYSCQAKENDTSAHGLTIYYWDVGESFQYPRSKHFHNRLDIQKDACNHLLIWSLIEQHTYKYTSKVNCSNK